MNPLDQNNLFLILELDPDQPWSQADFERQLQNKRYEWSRLVNFANEKGLKAKTNLSLLPKFKEVAQDESQRKLHAEEARKARKAGQVSKLQQFQKHLGGLEVRGHIFEEEVSQLRKEFGDILTEAQIRAAIKVPIKKNEQANRPVRPNLELSTAKDIQRKLENLGKNTLYDFLGMGSNTENRLLVERAKNLYDSIQRKASKTPQDTLTSELSGHCLALFANDAERAKYDETLRLQAYEVIKANADTMAAVSKQLEGSQINLLLEQAREKGLDIAETQAILKEHAASKKYTLIIASGTVESTRELLRCGHCEHLNAKDKSFCTRCSKSLKVACPKCNRALTSEERACGNCGFPIGNAPWTDLLLSEVAEAMREKEYSTARERLSAALSAWPAPEKDARIQQIRTAEAQIKRERASQDKLLEEINGLIKERKFFQARKFLSKVRSSFATGYTQLVPLEQSIEQTIKRAEAIFLRSSTDASAKNEQARLRNYQNVLDLCADYDDGNLAQQVQSLTAKLQQSEQSKVKFVNELKIAQRERRYFAARDLLGKIKHDYDTADLVHIESEITSKVHDVQQVLTQARALVGRDEAKVVQLCMQALQICQDARDAKTLLAQVPPGAPTNLQVSVRGDVAHLTWEESTSAQIRYLIVRKAHSRPLSATDGEPLATVDDTRYDDKTLEVGIPTFYAIFTDRAGVRSARGTMNSKAVMRIQQVQNVSKAIEEQRLYLRWEPPPHVHEVIVRRAVDGFPKDINAGQPLYVVNQRETVDSQIRSGQRYFYSIFSTFREYEGTLRTTLPVQVEVLAHAPPAPITDLKLVINSAGAQQQLSLQWSPPTQGEVVILHTKKTVDLRFGQTLPYQDLEKYGRVLTTRESQIVLPIKQVGTNYFYPIVVVQGTGYVGQRQEYFSLSDVSNLRVEDLGHALRIRWDWPINCEEVELTYSHLGWPDQESTLSVVAVNKRQYERTGCYELPTPKRLDYFVWVRTVVDQGGERMHSLTSSAGNRALVERPNHMILEYRLVKERRFLSPSRLTLQITLRKGTGVLPALILVGKEGSPPVSRHDGVVVLRINPQLLADTTGLIYDLGEFRQPATYSRLFLEDDRRYQFIELRHPDSHQLKLF